MSACCDECKDAPGGCGCRCHIPTALKLIIPLNAPRTSSERMVMHEVDLVGLDPIGDVNREACRMASRGRQPTYVLLGWETWSVIRWQLEAAGKKPKHGSDDEYRLATPAGPLTVIVDHENARGARLLPRPSSAMAWVSPPEQPQP